MSTLRVKYCGSREIQADRLFGSGVTWRGNGDVQVMEEMKALRLTSYDPNNFKIVQDGAEVAAAGLRRLPATQEAGYELPREGMIRETNGMMVPMEDASRMALAAHADALGMQLPASAKRDDILEAIQNVEAAAAPAGGEPDPEPDPPPAGDASGVPPAGGDPAGGPAQAEQTGETAAKIDEALGGGEPDPDPDPDPGKENPDHPF